SRRRHTRFSRDWSSDVCSSDLIKQGERYDSNKLDERHRDHALFIAYAPAEDPQIALSIIVENGESGGAVAGPIARKVMDYYLLGKEPENSGPTVTAALPPEAIATHEGHRHD